MKNTAAKKATATQAGRPAPTPSLEQLTSRWAQAKNAEETAKREADRLRGEITAAGAKIGYADANLEIGPFSKLDPEDKRLEEVLRETGNYEKALEQRISVARIQAIAELDPAVAKAVERATSTSPRFQRVAKKS